MSIEDARDGARTLFGARTLSPIPGVPLGSPDSFEYPQEVYDKVIVCRVLVTVVSS